MNFTNSPYERMMKEIPHKAAPTHKRHRKEHLVRGVLIGEGSVVFFAARNTSKSKADV